MSSAYLLILAYYCIENLKEFLELYNMNGKFVYYLYREWMDQCKQAKSEETWVLT